MARGKKRKSKLTRKYEKSVSKFDRRFGGTRTFRVDPNESKRFRSRSCVIRFFDEEGGF